MVEISDIQVIPSFVMFNVIVFRDDKLVHELYYCIYSPAHQDYVYTLFGYLMYTF